MITRFFVFTAFFILGLIVPCFGEQFLAPRSFNSGDNLPQLLNELTQRGAYRVRPFVEAVLDYYDHVDIKDVKKNSDEAAKVLSEQSIVEEVYGLGFPFYYGGQQSYRSLVESRIARSIQKVLEKDGDITTDDEIQLMLSVVPDLDSMVIYNSKNTAGPFSPVDDMEQKMEQSFLDTYRDIFSRLKKALDQKNTHIGGVDEWQAIIADFKFKMDDWSKARLHLDILFVADHVWKEMPFFVKNSDQKNFLIIRDILFTSFDYDRPASDVVKKYRENFLLYSMINEGLDIADFDRIYRINLNRHPYKDLINSSPSISIFTYQLWEEVMEGLVESGFINKRSQNNTYSITTRGREHLASVLQVRDHIYEHGYPTSQGERDALDSLKSSVEKFSSAA